MEEHNTIIVNTETGEVDQIYDSELENIIYPETTLNYDDRVVELLRLRYDVNRELKMHRERFSNPEQFQEFENYFIECQTQAKEECGLTEI